MNIPKYLSSNPHEDTLDMHCFKMNDFSMNAKDEDIDMSFTIPKKLDASSKISMPKYETLMRFLHMKICYTMKP